MERMKMRRDARREQKKMRCHATIGLMHQEFEVEVEDGVELS